ncbi:MAG TPA: hypothetical protein VGF04_02695 [Solirubrobacterales bacterium]|jgi:hypothetical protein
MKQGKRQNAPALGVSLLALFVALSGTVYAAARINGRAIKLKSLPGNRVKPHSIPANRLKRGVLKGARLSGPLTGAEINEITLSQVPSAAHADSADTAQSAVDAQTALNAVNAVDASTVNGHSAGCLPGTQPFAGACWQTSPSEVDGTAEEAASSCAKQGGTLPGALELSAFARLPGINLTKGVEWTGDVTNVSGLEVFGVVTVNDEGEIDFELSSEQLYYRCVIPLVT